MRSFRRVDIWVPETGYQAVLFLASETELGRVRERIFAHEGHFPRFRWR